LNKGYFKPFAIFFSVIFVPLILLSFFALIVNKTFLILLITLILVFSYCLGILFAHRISKSQKKFINIYDDICEIHYPGIVDNEEMCRINMNNIIKIEYYRISSPISWLMLLHSYILPQCIFITFKHNGKEVHKHLGYVDYIEICSLCNQFDIDLVVK
jgi:hypothetical protein